MKGQIKYIFCISTGRSGSKYLADLFGVIPGVISVHEPEPQLNGRPMTLYLEGKEEGIQELMDSKLLRTAETVKGSTMYIETTHCFIKGFGWELPKHIDQDQLGIIILKRDHQQVVQSYLRIGCSQFTYKGAKWLLSHRLFLRDSNLNYRLSYTLSYIWYTLLRLLRKMGMINNERNYLPAFVKANEERFLHWYCKKSDDLTKIFMAKFPSIKYFELGFTELNNEGSIIKLLNYFNLDESQDLVLNSVHFGVKANTKQPPR